MRPPSSDLLGGRVADPAVPVELSVVIVAYQSRDDLGACLGSLLQDLGELDAEVIVVDNASGDGTVAWLGDSFPQVVVLAQAQNTGFARAVNAGAALARGEHLLLLNPDTVTRPGTVGALLAAARRAPYAGLFGGRTLTAEGALDPRSCWGRPTLWSAVCFATGLSTAFAGSRLLDPESLGSWPRDTAREVDVVTGCLLLVSREAWQDLGGFDPVYFMYGEDADLAARARERGWRPQLVPEAEVVHFVGSSSSSTLAKSRLLFRGKATYARRHLAPRRAPALGLLLLQTGVGVRALAACGAAATGRTAGTSWRELWRERATWSAGWS